MTVRDSILEIFEKNKGKTLSGEELAQSLGVSRASVWKAVRSLRGEGYPIFASTNRGYTFMENDILWHYRTPQGEEYDAALAELEAQRP